MQRNQIIEEASTPFLNSLVVVRKRDGTIRLCFDARKLNKITKPQYENLRILNVYWEEWAREVFSPS